MNATHLLPAVGTLIWLMQILFPATDLWVKTQPTKNLKLKTVRPEQGQI
jgi:hypothetical protein